MKKNNLYLLIILLPIFDLITSLYRRFFETSFSFGIVIKTIIVVLMFIFILLYKNKDKRKLIILFLIYLIYMIIHILLNSSNKGIEFNEIYSLGRFFFFPILFFVLYYLIKDSNIDKDKFKKNMLISMGIYMAVFAFSYITRTSFSSYVGDNLGGVGWYFAANEISAIMLLLFPFIYYILDKNKIVLFYIVGIITTFFISLIGTKVSSFGILIIAILYLIFPIIFRKKDYKKNIKHNVLMILIMLLILFGSPSMFNLRIATEKVTNEYLAEQEKFNKECESGTKCDNYYYRKIMLMLLSGRNVYLKDTNNIYRDNFNTSTFLFGLGTSNSLQMDENSNKWIEMDFFDLYYNYGILGMVLVLSPLLFVIYLTVKNKIIFKKLNFDNTMYMFIILLILSVSFIAGHVVGAPAVSTYLVIYLLLYLKSINSLKGSALDKKKISILNLHLGHGGIEQANVNLSNMLVSEYEVELVTLYKTVDVIPYYIDPRVKVIYLTDLKPNKKEVLDAIKKKDVVNIIKEGFKSVKILFLKKYLINKFIINSDSKFIVSSRIEFNYNLSNYGRGDMIKISQEHRHHDDDSKYINKLHKSLSNIDYFFPVSKELKEYYQENFKDINVEYIKHALSYYPDKQNKYNGKKLITVGRLSKEKGYLDLIDVFNELNKIDKNYTLTIVGSGFEEELIKEKINKYKLNKKIKMTGFLNKEELNKEYSKSSLYLMTSTSESFGLVLIEAMSFGIPCISFDTARGAFEIINNRNGKIVERDNTIMVDNILNIMNDKSAYEKMSDEARRTSNKYKFETIQKEWLKFFKGL